MVKFISYDGKWPCLCMGTLTLNVDGKTYVLNHAMISGGSVWHDSDWNFTTEHGDWKVDLNEFPELEKYKDEIERVVNENVECGCCGGCI